MLDEFRACEPHTLAQILTLLDDPRARHFVKMVVFTARDVPRALLGPMVLAGARTTNPSFNKHFIWPCVLCHGRRPVVRELVRIFRTGPAEERAGAAHALYWGSMGRGDISWPHDPGRPSGEADDPVDDLLAELERSVLSDFLQSGDVRVRRVLLARLPKRTAENAVLFDEVVAAARASDDAYLRERLAYELGESRLIPCLPDPATEGG